VHRFVGIVTNKLDAKNRVSIPALFRQSLANQQTDGLYCFKAVGRTCLIGFGNKLFEKTETALEGQHPIFSPNYAAQATAIYAQARHLAFDDEGRVRVPDDLISYASIGERVLFAGLGEMFEIWDPDAYYAMEAERLQQVEADYKNGGGK
jgi:MraZ protein